MEDKNESIDLNSDVGHLEFRPNHIKINNNLQRNTPQIIDLIYQGDAESSGGQIYLKIPTGVDIKEITPEKGIYILYTNADNSEIHYGRLQGKLIKGDKIMSLEVDFKECSRKGTINLDTKTSIVLSSESVDTNGISFECNGFFISNYVYIILIVLILLFVAFVGYFRIKKTNNNKLSK